MAALPTVMVTGTVYTPDGDLYNGDIAFRKPVLTRHSDGTTVLAGTVTAPVINGVLDVELLYVDAAGWGPTGWAYEVGIRSGSIPRSYSLAPLTADGNVNLGDLVLPGYVPDPGVDYVTQADLGGYATQADLAAVGTPDLTPYALLSGLSPVATAGTYASLTGKPSLATVASTGVYADLSGKPTISTVGATGAYADLTGKPTIPTVSTAGTTGAYADLTGKPTIPAAYTDVQAAAAAPVQSVASRTGAVTLTKADVALGNVDNTSDVNKPVSTAGSTALALKANLASPTFTGTVAGITAAMVGLGSVNNTSDAAKPVSTAQQAAITNLGIWTPAQQNLVGATGDPGNAQAGTVLPTAGLMTGVRIQAVSGTVTNIILHLIAGGATLTAGQCFAALFNDAGALLGAGAVTADQATNWASGGLKVMPLTVAQAVTPGAFYRVGWWFNGTTGPQVSRGANISNVLANVGLVAPNFRWFTANTGLTTAAPGTIGTQTSLQTAYWAGLS